MNAATASNETAETAEFDWPELLTRVALILAMVLVTVRITVLEVVRDTFSMPDQFGSLGPGPTSTLVLDLLCWIPALLVLLRRAVDRRYTLRVHVSHLLMALLGGWVAASCFWASDKFQAIVTASTWCAAMSLGWAMCQLVRSWTRLRLVAAVAVGLAGIFVAQGIIYRFFEWPETVKQWDAMKEQTFQQQGWSPDEFAAQQYDAKIRRGEMVGFFRSPNTYAAAVAMAALVAMGLGIQRLRDNLPPALALLCLIPAACSIWILIRTDSRTALAGFFLCVALYFLAWRFSGILFQRSRLLYAAACGLVALGCIVLLLIGLKTGGLIHDSMTFRWNYWVGSWAMFKQHPLLGVGWSNFGNGYLPFRLPIAAEEIKDPHNAFVKFLTETGLVGLLLALAWIARIAWEATRPILPKLPAVSPNSSPPAPTSVTWLFIAVPLSFVALRYIVNMPVSLALPEISKLLLFGFVLAFCMIVSTVRSAEDLNADDRPAPLALLGVLCALAGFLLHGMVDFAMFEIGPSLLMMMLVGAVLGIRHPGAAGSRPRTRTALVALGAVFFGWIAFMATIVIPVGVAEARANEGEELAFKNRYPAAATAMREAFTAAPVNNADYMYRCAQYLMQGRAASQDILGAITMAINADPANPAYWAGRAQYRQSLGTDASGAIEDYRQYFQRNPADVKLRITFADYLRSLGQSPEAAEQYRLALQYNEGLHPNEPRRLKPERVDELKRLAQ